MEDTIREQKGVRVRKTSEGCSQQSVWLKKPNTVPNTHSTNTWFGFAGRREMQRRQFYINCLGGVSRQKELTRMDYL